MRPDSLQKLTSLEDNVGVQAITRRGALLGGLAAALRMRCGGASHSKILLFLIDGFGPEYFAASEMPNLRRMAREGVHVNGEAIVPTVTNVNNASLLTASLPSEHGITGNYYYDRSRRQGVFMETPEFLLRPTIFETARRHGMRSALVTAKDKLRSLASRGADIAVSGENAPADLLPVAGPKPDMFSAEVNYWVMRAARHLLKTAGIDLMYLTTTDYMMHAYPPEDARSQEHLHTVDRLLGEILNDFPGIEVCVTADHGMSAKTEAIDVTRLLAARGVVAEAVPVIKDRYVVHHQGLGGACYVYLDRPQDLSKAEDLLRGAPGIEAVYRAPQAARQFHLREDRIGDLVLLGTKPVVFGALNEPREAVKLRSHGSRHEAAVPIVCYGRKVDPAAYKLNADTARNLAWPS